MRKATKYLVVHSAATRPHMDIGVAEIRQWHQNIGYSDVGYHYVIRRDGRVEKGRDLKAIGSHVKGYNAVSVGICMVGGLDMGSKPANNYTPEQFASLKRVLLDLKTLYPHAEILGHRDLSPDKNKDGKITPDEWLKSCPCFDVREWWRSVLD